MRERLLLLWFFTIEFWNLSNWQRENQRDFMRRLVYEFCTKTLCNYSQTNQSTFTYPFTSVYISLCLHIGLHLVSPSHYNQDHHCSDSLSEFTSLKERIIPLGFMLLSNQLFLRSLFVPWNLQMFVNSWHGLNLQNSSEKDNTTCVFNLFKNQDKLCIWDVSRWWRWILFNCYFIRIL